MSFIIDDIMDDMPTSITATTTKGRRSWLGFVSWMGVAFIGCTFTITFLMYSQRSSTLTFKGTSSSGNPPLPLLLTPTEAVTEIVYSSNHNKRDLIKWGNQFQGYNCTNERWNHQTRMYKNMFQCSMKNSYIFGVSKTGDLIWKNLATGKTKMYYQNIYNHKSNYFYLTLDGKFQVIGDNGEILWEKYPGNYKNIGYHLCLTGFACPYLHLHPDGVNVLNWVDSTYGNWITKNINSLYGI
jgi:hypothetical protein